MQKERIWILLGKRQCGEASEAELAELNALLKEEESARFSEDTIDKLWNVPLKTVDASQGDLNWNRLHNRIKKTEEKKPYKRWWLSVAASVLLLGAVLFFKQTISRHDEPAKNKTALRWNNIATPANARSKIELPDGSKVWINGDSCLTYDSRDFGIRNREITLQGEAYFEVKTNASLPFIVHLQNVDIRVLGTAFNVKAYAKDKNIEATLINGKIAVSLLNGPEKKIILKPEEKIIIPKALPRIKRINTGRPVKILKIKKDKAGLAQATLWMRKELVFDNETFAQIARQMETWYRVKIRFANDSLKKLHFSGIIKEETLPEALRAMQLSQHFNFYIKDSSVRIGDTR